MQPFVSDLSHDVLPLFCCTAFDCGFIYLSVNGVKYHRVVMEGQLLLPLCYWSLLPLLQQVESKPQEA